VKTASEKVAFWQQCKMRAARDPQGMAVGLTKVAYELWADAWESGMGAAPREIREAFASSFGCAYVVEQGIQKMAAMGQVAEDEAQLMQQWVAESAIEDLKAMVKSANAMRDPRVVGALLGAATGAGAGAWRDEDNRLRGAAMGLLPGATIGALGGQMLKSHGDFASKETVRKATDAAEAALDAAKRKGRGQSGYDAMLHVAQSLGAQRGNTDIEQAVAAAKDQLQEHFAQGLGHFPEALSAVFTDPTDRLAFMQRVQKVMPKHASLKSKLADIMQGLENGGQPPMNADGPQPPPGSLEGGDEGLPPSTDPAAQGGEAIGEQPQIADGALDGLDKAHKTIDNMIFLAQQVQMPQLAQQLDQMRDQLAEHFAAGHAYLPPELQHHFAQSEHAEAFMKKYKQRFGAVGGGGQKKAASAKELAKLALFGLR
jgi:hypothetical protein